MEEEKTQKVVDLYFQAIEAMNKEHYAYAFQILQETVRQGLPEGAATLGTLYANGLGTERNLETAVKFWEFAAQQGAVEGLVNMGVSYWTGQVVGQDKQKAVNLLEQAARLDDWGYEVLQELVQEEPENVYLQEALKRL
jgi:TPR repeat protein